MSEQNNSSDVDVDGIEATREGTKQPSNQEGSILQACREEWGGGGGGATGALSPPPSLTGHRGSLFRFCFCFLAKL